MCRFEFGKSVILLLIISNKRSLRNNKHIYILLNNFTQN